MRASLQVLLVGGCAAALIAGQALARGGEPDRAEVVDLRPAEMAGFGLRNLVAPVAALFLGYSYWYRDREIQVETVPPGSLVDLFYVRSSFQKRFEQAETPVTILLPSRIEAGPRDSITIRAFHEGYRQKTEVLKVNARTNEVVIELEPLPNTLRALAHRYFAGRSVIRFLTEERLAFRVQEAEDGFSVILTETAMSHSAAAALEGIQSPLLRGVFAQQLGEDLLVKVMLVDEVAHTIELRSRDGYDAARALHEFALDLVPSDGGADAVSAALAALARIQPADVRGCALEYEAALRERLDPGALSRALTPKGAFVDRYLRAAMRRLGEVVPEGAVDFGDGARFRPAVGFELEVALSRAGQATGYLALLRAFVVALGPEEFTRETLRGLIAPELDPATFGVILDEAEAAEAACLSLGGGVEFGDVVEY